MSNRRRPRNSKLSPQVRAFAESARTLGYHWTDDVAARQAALLLTGFQAPDTTDAMMVDELATHGVYGDRALVARLVAVGRLHLVNGEG